MGFKGKSVTVFDFDGEKEIQDKINYLL